MILKFKKLHPKAITPCYAKQGDAGLDFYATEIFSMAPFQAAYGTGIAVEIPQGYVGLMFPRSSIFKYALSLSNSVGVIDSGYRGEVKFIFNKTEVSNYPEYKVGDKIGQLVVVPIPSLTPVEVVYLSVSDRGDGGFGSSGS